MTVTENKQHKRVTFSTLSILGITILGITRVSKTGHETAVQSTVQQYNSTAKTKQHFIQLLSFLSRGQMFRSHSGTERINKLGIVGEQGLSLYRPHALPVAESTASKHLPVTQIVINANITATLLTLKRHKHIMYSIYHINSTNSTLTEWTDHISSAVPRRTP